MLESEAAAGALAGAASESSISESSEVGGAEAGWAEADVEGTELAGPSDGANGALAVASVDGLGGGERLAGATIACPTVASREIDKVLIALRREGLARGELSGVEYPMSSSG